MNKKENYHIYTHCNPSISDLGSFVSESESLGIGLNIVDLLNYQDENGNYNLDNLTANYTYAELKDNKSKIELIKSYRRSENELKPLSENKANLNANIKTNIVVKKEDYVAPKNISSLNSILTSNTEFYIYKVSSSNNASLSGLYDDNVKGLFLKFIYLIETTTDYKVEITNSVRSLEEQKSEINKGNSKYEFSYHMVGLAIDINLIHKTDSSLNLYKSSSSEDWSRSGVTKISDNLKLTWGGKFGNVNNDPVHFECSYFYSVNKDGYVEALKDPSKQSKIETNEIINSDGEVQIDNSSFSDLPIKMGTVLNLSVYKVDRTVLTTETNQTVNTVDYESFLAKELVRLLSDKAYKRVFTPQKNTEFKGTVQEIFPYISVWVWSRAMSLTNISNKPSYEHKIINITPYITSLTTNNGGNGGNFSVIVSPIIGDLRNNNWELRKGSQQDSKTSNKQYHVNSGHIHYIKDKELKRNNFFLEKALQANDIVFIKFEKLELETERDNLNDVEFISIDKLPNQIFDMIGLVDDINTSINFQGLDCNISITGRDFIKLLIEDGVYFYPSQFTDSGIFANTGSTNNRLLRFNGQIKNRFQESNKSVEKSLKFLMNNLGEIEIAPSSLFDSYGNVKIDKNSDIGVNLLSTFNQLVDKNTEETNIQLKKIEDKKQNIINNVENIVKSNSLDQSMSVSIYNTIKSFLSQLIDDKSITIIGQKIKQWDYTINGIVYKNRIPDSLDEKFIVFDKNWSRDNGKIVGNINNYAIIDGLQNLYDNTNKNEILNSNLSNFNNFRRNNSTNKKKDFVKTIPINSIIFELDDHVKNINSSDKFDDINNNSTISISEVEKIKNDNELAKSQGVILFLNIVSKLFDELNSDEKNIFNDIYNLIIEEKNIQKNINTEEKLTPMLGVWGIIKLVIDDSVKDRRIVDPSIGNENGSLLNAIRKICQDPFCEFYTDTYGSQFYFIVRKKPFDQESVLSMLEGRVIYDRFEPISGQIIKDVTRNGTVLQSGQYELSPTSTESIVNQNLIIDIEEKDVLSDSLSYSVEAYSWYKLNLANLTQGSQESMAFAYLRAVYFEEYADIFGSKPLDLTTSYIPFSPVIDKNKKYPTAYFIKQAVYDLKYMIESHAYLPFTRMGTITINGDRRIKRGTFVRLKSTNEIFYVDSVNQSYAISEDSIDRETTLQVSRGMVEDYIKGKNFVDSNGNNVNISYFNICNLQIDKKIFEDQNSTYSNFLEGSISTWKVNTTIFNFFLKKLQFNNGQ